VQLLDASVWVAAVMPVHPHHESARKLIGATERPLGALDLTLYEVANALALKYRQPADARRLIGLIVARCADRVTSVSAGLLDLAVGIAAEHGISAYDAAYVAAARQVGWQLVSLDFRDLVGKGLAIAPAAALYP
jgi:predicted nucleic acid-binding protein